MPTLGVETLEFKEQKQDVDDPNQGFRSRLSRGSTRSVTGTGTALIIRIVALNDAALKPLVPNPHLNGTAMIKA
jgi:hypothetical protein